MNSSSREPLSRLAIPAKKKGAPRTGAVVLTVVPLLVIAVLAFLVFRERHPGKPEKTRATAVATPATLPPPPVVSDSNQIVLTAVGYIVPRERIELSSKIPGSIKWIGVRKGDRVKKSEVLVRLEDDEYRARLLEAEGRLALAEANRINAETNYHRQLELTRTLVDTVRAMDDARRALAVAEAEVKIAQGQLALAHVWLDWCTITSPIDGTVLEKLVDANELIIPQSFGVPRGPATTLVALADLSNLEVEIDVNQADVAKVQLGQRCRIRPEAYTDKTYPGHVAEIAPEADRQKGTLEVKVKIENPDNFLVPELNARVDFLAKDKE